MKLTSLLFALSLSAASAQNLVVLNNATFNGGNAAGGVFVQGSVSGSNYEANNHNLTTPALWVGGNNLISNFLRVNHGAAEIVGTKGNYQGTQADFDTPDFGYFENLSSNYSSLQGSSVNLSNPNNVAITLTKELNVFDVTAAQFSGNKTLDFIGSGKVVFNVTGNLNSWGWSVNKNANDIVFNFEDATFVNINDRSFSGSLIAPNALVQHSQQITGLVVTKDFENFNSAALNYATLPIPEPGILAFVLFATGLIFLRK